MENQNKGLDKNQIIGFVLIAAIMGVFGWWQSINAPDEPIVPVVEESQESVSESELVVQEEFSIDSTADENSNGFLSEEFIVENNDLKLTFSTKGARMVSAQVKDYQTYDSLPLYLVNENQTMDLILPGAESLGQKGFIIDAQTSSGANLMMSGKFKSNSK